MKYLFILDPFEKLHLEADTSLLLMNEALRRGREVYS
ncbi:MAG: glutathione synthase, partial [Candidatus Auribacterota bacterium]|nr:glutathione synthase [Candidatus Auribacterota bacterium]